MLFSKAQRLFYLGIVIVAPIGFTHRLTAQDTTAKILGQVTDASGALLPGATVTVTNTATKIEATDQSDNKGAFQFVQLPIGTYTVGVAKQGFASVTVTRLHAAD